MSDERDDSNERNVTLETRETIGTIETKRKRCTPADFGREGQECEGSGEGEWTWGMGVGGACYVLPLCPGVEASEVGGGEVFVEGVCPGIASAEG